MNRNNTKNKYWSVSFVQKRTWIGVFCIGAVNILFLIFFKHQNYFNNTSYIQKKINTTRVKQSLIIDNPKNINFSSLNTSKYCIFYVLRECDFYNWLFCIFSPSSNRQESANVNAYVYTEISDCYCLPEFRVATQTPYANSIKNSNLPTYCTQNHAMEGAKGGYAPSANFKGTLKSSLNLFNNTNALYTCNILKNIIIIP